MQSLITVATAIAGMAFSFAVALLVEELIFGKVFGLFFAQPAAVPVPTKEKQ